MKSHNYCFNWLLLLACMLTSCFSTNEKESQAPQNVLTSLNSNFDLTIKTANVILPIKNVGDTADVKGRSEIRFPLEYPSAATSVVGDSIYLAFPMQWPSYVTLYWGDTRQRLFLIPGDTLNILQEEGSLTYRGKSAPINDYLRAKEDAFGITDFITAKGMLTSTTSELDSMASMVDAISAKEIDFLNAYANDFELPDWYVDFESSEIRYFGGVVKLSAPGYRGVMLNKLDKPSANYFDFLETLPVSNPQAVLSVYYYEFLNHLTRHYYLTDSLKNREVGERLPIILENSLRFYDEHLEAPIRDYMYMYILSRAITSSYPLDDELIQDAINRLDDSKHQTLVRKIQLSQAHNEIPKGSRAPEFLLPDEKATPVSLKDFEGRIVLLSFWATWCKPCLKEIPYENQLVKSLEQDGFSLLSICMGSSKAAWQASLERYQLNAVNLYANEEWQEKLYELYLVNSLPHYVLIDEEGRIIEHKTSRPSEDSLRIKVDKALANLEEAISR